MSYEAGMNTKVVFTARDISKSFRLGQHISFQRFFLRLWYWVTHKFRQLEKKSDEGQRIIINSQSEMIIKAIKNISFNLKAGERVAIVGRNGAGKSTLLKIMVGIMTPTSGSIEINGSIFPLLGLNTGFNQELTGYENIFLNGAILGIKPNEMEKLLPEISEFSEISDFFDTPIKRYSKGMKARLGLAIAICAKPEIMVVDEVLAVGDLKFRAKCMNKIMQMCDEGMTLVFVSHSPSRIRRLCTRGILLRDGELILDDDVEVILEKFLTEDLASDDLEDDDADDLMLQNSTSPSPCELNPIVSWAGKESPGDEVVKICSIATMSAEGTIKSEFSSTEEIVIKIDYEVLTSGFKLRPQIQVLDPTTKETIFVSIENHKVWSKKPREAGQYITKTRIPARFMAAGSFLIGGSVYCHQPLKKHARTGGVINIKVTNEDDFSSVQSDYPRQLPGYISPSLTWHTNQKGN